VLQTDQPLEFQRAAAAVYVDPALMEYAVRLVRATREPLLHGLDAIASYVRYGASPRAAINLALAGRARAFLHGRDYALADDVRDLALDVMRHRLVLSYEALADGVTPDELLHQVVLAVSAPELPLDDRARNLDTAAPRSQRG
jgi:MoxR-like ATPase